MTSLDLLILFGVILALAIATGRTIKKCNHELEEDKEDREGGYMYCDEDGIKWGDGRW